MKQARDQILAAVGWALMLIPGIALAQAPLSERYDYGPRMMSDGAWYGMTLGPLLMLVVLAVAIALVVLLVRWLAGPWHGAPLLHPPVGRTPLDILKERFARGEIDGSEYEERRRVLGE